MSDKAAILKTLTPPATLRVLTKEGKNSIPRHHLKDDLIPINEYPYRVGRESRVVEIDGKFVHMERKKISDNQPNNDLYLIDHLKPMHISRKHFQIEKNNSGYRLKDNGSSCGIYLEKSGSKAIVKIGGNNKGGTDNLEDGDIITVGAENSPYVFEFIVL